MGFIGLIVIGLGIFNLTLPRAAWYLSEGWKFQDAEPSDAALILARLSGVFLLIFGLFIMFH